MYQRFSLKQVRKNLHSIIQIDRNGSSIDRIDIDLIYPISYDQHDLIENIRIKPIALDPIECKSMKLDESYIQNSEVKPILLKLNSTEKVVDLVGPKSFCFNL
ncbi:hypothetical protein SSS_09826 [Sarcoptes scabiei]|nr:hypothetical protein SSS_09826 [Sarcoptes scabiei]